MSLPSSTTPTVHGLVYGAGILLFTFVVTLFASVQLGAGWWWDMAGGVGFVALALYGLLNLATGQGARLPSHKVLGWWALALTALHAGLYLVTDSIAINHLKLAAPPAMLVGVAALVVALCGALISLPRWKLRTHGSRDNFRRYHRLMSWFVLVGCLYHVGATAHSVHHLAQLLLLGGGAFVLLVMASKTAPKLPGHLPIVGLLLLSIGAVGSFVVLRNV